ncbi:MAG TPA: hypothetical protein VI077_06890 [Pseudolabrys sp.]|jgi:hypothetical protein
MNSSLWSAGRNTHLKIVAVSLMASIIVVAIGINARLDNGANERIGTDQIVVKAGKTKTFTDNSGSIVR